LADRSSSTVIRRPGQEQMRGLKLGKFINEVVSELRKSVWPTRDEVIRLTWVVLVIASFVGGILGFLDFSYSRTFTKYIVLP
jgi:preprotein translocase subunit SecE